MKEKERIELGRQGDSQYLHIPRMLSMASCKDADKKTEAQRPGQILLPSRKHQRSYLSPLRLTYWKGDTL